MAANRKPISKKVRFEIFKRDSFTCQYCGSHPPSVILEPDHIHPISAGGDNSMDNLITACFDCNRGKAARPLTDIPQSLISKYEEVAEREAQIKAYQKLMKSKRKRIDLEVHQVCSIYELYNAGYTLSEPALTTVRKFLEKLDVHQVCDAMETANSKTYVRKGSEFKYFCGICWNIIKGHTHG
jgi:hypothetical protein